VPDRVVDSDSCCSEAYGGRIADLPEQTIDRMMGDDIRELMPPRP